MRSRFSTSVLPPATPTGGAEGAVVQHRMKIGNRLSHSLNRWKPTYVSVSVPWGE
jgi:hypothetical protein